MNNSHFIYRQLDLDKNVRVVRDLRRSFKLEKLLQNREQTISAGNSQDPSSPSENTFMISTSIFRGLMGLEESLVDTVGFYIHVHCSILSRIIKDIN